MEDISRQIGCPFLREMWELSEFVLSSEEMIRSESVCDGDGAHMVAVAVELASESDDMALILLSVADTGAVFPAQGIGEPVSFLEVDTES